MTGFTNDSERMNELAKVRSHTSRVTFASSFMLVTQPYHINNLSTVVSQVKAELEDALRQVKQEMKDGGAACSQFGASTVRSSSVLSSVRHSPSLQLSFFFLCHSDHSAHQHTH